jgi:predicted metal-binding protein
MYKKVDPTINYKVRGLCRKPYHNHPKGCPNWGKDKCPPKLPRFENYFDIDEPIYFIWTKFNIGEHIEKQREKHPDWTEPQLRNSRHWQGKARKKLKEEVQKFKNEHPEYEISYGPEAMGVDCTDTMKKLGIELEWPPNEWTYQIAMAGIPKKKIIKTFEVFSWIE